MPDTHDLSVSILDGSGNTTINLDATTADVMIGGHGQDALVVGLNAGGIPRMLLSASDAHLELGNPADSAPGLLHVRDNASQNALEVVGSTRQVTVANPQQQGTLRVHGDLRVLDAQGREVLFFDASTGLLRVGANGNEGDLQVYDGQGRRVFNFNGSSAWLEVGADGNEGDLVVRDQANRSVFHMDGQNAALYVGAAGNEGDVIVRDDQGRQVFHANGSNAAVYVGAEGNEGDVIVRDSAGRDVIHADGNNAVLYVGAQGNEGDIIVRDASNREVFHMDGNNAWLRIGTTGNEGDLAVHDASDRRVLHFDANYAALYVGAAGNEGDVIVRDDAGNDTIHLNGQTGDIILRNADAAEDFTLHPSWADGVEPGTVMVLDDDGRIAPSASAYDARVVGVVAGAGDYRPGLIMDRQEHPSEPRVPISMMGKVSVKADARHGAIRVGDLLTTSPTTGAAMAVSDRSQAFGAVIGKALTPLAAGEGFVNLLISMR
ncbi:MAG: hypothetical protein R3E98_08835 [Gemmatimonadota bacterium]